MIFLLSFLIYFFHTLLCFITSDYKFSAMLSAHMKDDRSSLKRIFDTKNTPNTRRLFAFMVAADTEWGFPHFSK